MVKYWKYDEFSGKIQGRTGINKEVVATKDIADLQEFINTDFKDFPGGQTEIDELKGIAKELGLFQFGDTLDASIKPESDADLDDLMNEMKEEEEKPLDKE